MYTLAHSLLFIIRTGARQRRGRKACLRILIYGLNYSPELTGIGKYTGELAAWLAHRGHEVRVVTAPPYYPAWKIRDDYRGRWYRVEHAPGEPVVYRTPLYVPERPTGIKRIIHLISFVLGSAPVLLRQMYWQPQIVFTVEPTFFCAPLTLFVSKCAGAASWLHVQDFEVDAAFELGLLPAQGPVHDAALRIENFLVYAFDRVSGVSSRMVERAIAKGIAPQRAVLFPNWVDICSIRPLGPDSRASNRVLQELARVQPEICTKTILLYSGNMGAKQGLERLAPLAESFRDDHGVHFVFCGDGAFRSRLAAGEAELFLDRGSYDGPRLQPGDAVRAIDRNGEPVWEISAISDRYSNLIVAVLREK